MQWLHGNFKIIFSHKLCLFTTSSSVQIVLFVVAFVAQFVASIELYQVEFIEDGMNSIFPVEGVASVPTGGSPPIHYAFNCISTTNNGGGLAWSRKDGIPLTMTQNGIANGVQLNFENAASSDLTVYTCYNGTNGESVIINVTDGKEN